jgi:hypothetical protein
MSASRKFRKIEVVSPAGALPDRHRFGDHWQAPAASAAGGA